MNIGYVRVSTIEQHEDRQFKALEQYNIEKYFMEKVSAKTAHREQLNDMLEFARAGDTIYIKDFSRLARSTKDLLSIIERLEAKGVKLISLKEQLDTSTSTGKLMLTMIGAINEFERNNLLERQREGIAIAKEKGVYKGRKRIEFPTNWEDIYNSWKSRSITATKAMEELKLTKTTFYNLVKQYEVNK